LGTGNGICIETTVNRAVTPLPDCPIPEGTAPCLEECRTTGVCHALKLLLTDGRTLVGRPLGLIGETLRFQAYWPRSGPVLVPFAEAEAMGLVDCLRACTDPGDGPGLLLIAEVSAARGLVDSALRELERALRADPGLEPAVCERRTRLLDEAASRGIADAREHLAAGRTDHARAALEEVLTRFPSTEVAEEARALRRGMASPPAQPA
jgi:hypothetical protein